MILRCVGGPLDGRNLEVGDDRDQVRVLRPAGLYDSRPLSTTYRRQPDGAGFVLVWDHLKR